MCPSEPTEQNPIENDIIQLRNEFQEQFATLKESFEKADKEQKDIIAKLQEENDALHRAIVRSALNPEPQPEPVKTEQEIYEEKIKSLADKTIQYMKMR